MKSHEIRKRFLDFFEKRGHVILPSASLITEDDPKATNATLFNTAGMQPLIPYLLGETHPLGTRLASSQKCVRTGDLDEVGDNTHATFFEMLGNWSLGDYFKREAITWSYQFLTDPNEGLGLDPQRLYVTVFAGNDVVPRDDEAVEIWKECIPEHRIYFRDSKDNWWTAGPNSPAGPSTEMFYDLTGTLGDMTALEFEQADEEQKVVEIWNDVFMSYQLTDGVIAGNLPQQNVDTGAGLERVTAVMQGVRSIFDTDVYQPLIQTIQSHAKNYDERHARIIADHIKTSVFLMHDGVMVSNTGRGYVLRRIIRRAYQSFEALACPTSILSDLVQHVVDIYRDVYFHNMSQENSETMIATLSSEMDKMRSIVERGVKIFEKLKERNTHSLDGAFLVDLEQTHGLPFSVSEKLAQQFGLTLAPDASRVYEELTEQHQERSRQGAEKKFKGGLEQDTPKIRALHTATHLMLAGLRKYLGNEVSQKGSNITEERTRLDFNYGGKVERDVLDKVEQYVNEAIMTDALVSIDLMKKTDAQNDSTVIGAFWEKYPDEVQVYTIADSDGIIYSRELCGGPHVERLSDIAQFGIFAITKEEASSAGVRRIRAELK